MFIYGSFKTLLEFTMQKVVYCFIFIFITAGAGAQDSINNPAASIDSAAILKDLMSLLGNIEPTSYASVEIGAGNRLFSIHNNRINSRETSVNTFVFTPVIGYFHKSGFSLSAGAYLMNQNEKGFAASQYTITPGYDLLNNDRFAFSVSYTHSFVKDKFSPYTSPVQNDFYTALVYKKSWIQPGLALGYSTGTYGEYFEKDTVILGRPLLLYDSLSNHLKSFSVMVSASHDFKWNKVFGTDDALFIQPSIVLNMASSSINLTHNTNAPNFINRLLKRGRLPLLVTNGFKPESAGLNLNCNYSLGDFSLSPQVYLDYYLPETDSRRFSQSYSFTIGYTF